MTLPVPAKIFTIFEGTSEIQRMLIDRTVTGLDVRWDDLRLYRGYASKARRLTGGVGWPLLASGLPESCRRAQRGAAGPHPALGDESSRSAVFACCA
jgi:hypothetical protein